MFRRSLSVGAAAVAGGMLGASPFMLWLMMPNDSSYSLWLSEKVSNRINDYNHYIWQRGDKRPKRIILMRAGQTHGYSHTCACRAAGLPVCALKPAIDRPLTEEGVLQSLRAGVALKHIIGDETCTFFVSPYKACKQTFSYVSGSFPNLENCQYVEDPRLRNIDLGNFFLSQAPESQDDYQKNSEKVGRFFYRWNNGESVADVHDRVCSFLESLYRKWKHTDRPDNFVIITHSVVIQCFLMRWFHWDLNTFERLEKFKNGQLAIMEKQDDGSYRLVSPLPYRGEPKPSGVKFVAVNPGTGAAEKK